MTPRAWRGIAFGTTALSLLLLAPRPASGHGGQYRPPPEEDPPPPPPDPPPPPTRDSNDRKPDPPREPEPPPTKSPTPPSNPGPAPTPGTPTPPVRGPHTPDPTRGGGRRSRGPSLEEWTAWWYYSRDRWLVRPGSRAAASTGSLGTTAGGDGAGDAGPSDAREEAWRNRAREALLKAFGDADVEVFTGCAVALGKAGDPRDATPLLRALDRRFADGTVREALVLGLGLLGRDAPGAREALLAVVRDRKDSARLRGIAALALGISRDTAAAPALLAAASDRGAHRDPAAGALLGLGLLGEPLVVPDLVDLLDDTSDGDARALRPHAAFALGRIGGAEAVRALGRALGDSDAQVRRSAVLALGECAPPDAALLAPALGHVAREDRDRPCRNLALVTLGRIGGTAAYDALARIYSLGDRGERNFAALGLGILGRGMDDADARGRIATMLRGDFEAREDADFRGALATALGLLGDPKAAAALRAVVRDRGNPDLRAHCALALGLLGAKEAAPDLRAMAAEKGEPSLQRKAALALGLLGDPGAAKALSDLLGRTSSEYVRVSAAQALGHLGGPEAAKALEGLLADPAASGGARGQAAVGLGLLLDPRPVGGIADLSSGLNYLAPTPLILEVLSIP